MLCATFTRTSLLMRIRKALVATPLGVVGQDLDDDRCAFDPLLVRLQVVHA